MSKRLGFTVLEMLVVVGVLAILLIVTVPFLASFISRSDLKSTTWQIVDTLRRAQTEAKSVDQNAAWGVHFASNQYVLFMGSTYNSGDSNNIVTTVGNTLSITGITLNAGSSDVRFSSRNGSTADTGTITITDSSTGQTGVITITSVGLITSTL